MCWFYNLLSPKRLLPKQRETVFKGFTIQPLTMIYTAGAIWIQMVAFEQDHSVYWVNNRKCLFPIDFCSERDILYYLTDTTWK